MKLRALSAAFAVCLSVCAPVGATDLVGTWIAPPPDAYFYPPGHKSIGYPNSDAFTDRVVFKRGNGALTGTLLSVDGNTPLSELKVQGQSVSFSVSHAPDYIEKFRGTIRGDELQMVAIFSGSDGSVSVPYTWRKATASDLKTIAAGPTYSLQKLPLPSLHNVPTDNIAPTAPMGVGNLVVPTDAEVRNLADEMVANGMRDAGYIYIQMDEGWQGRRDAQGNIHPNANVPDMKALSDYVHSKGLKLGLYSSPGPAGCFGYAGSYGHERQDANTFAKWGIDYLKYDWCSAGDIYHTQEEMQAAYQKMGEALRATGRPILFGLCEYGLFDVSSWGRKVGGNLWRTGGDIDAADRWHSILSNGFEHNGKLHHAGADGWNDPDDLLIGKAGMTTEEDRTQMTLWSMMAAPLIVEIVNNNMATWTRATKDVLLNREVIAVDQDPLGVQGHRVFRRGQIEVWAKRLSDGTTAVALFNLGENAQRVNVSWDEVHLRKVQRVRDLWRRSDLGSPADGYKGTLPGHGTVLMKVAGGE